MNEFAARARLDESAKHRERIDPSGAAADSSFRSLVETSLQGIIVHRDWRILFANSAAAQTLGYDGVAELESVRNILSLFPADDRARIQGYGDARLRGEPAPKRYRARLLHKDGTIIHVDLLASVLDWQGEPAIQTAFVDISGSVRTQQMLRESEERYALAMRGANEGIWDWHIETDNLYVSPGVCRDLHIPVLDGAISSRVWIERIHPDDRAHARASLIAHLRGEEEYFRSEHRIRMYDGSYRWFLVHALASRRDNGRAYRLAGSLSDVTSRKQNEQALSDRLRFEAVMTRVSAEFIALPPTEIDAAIERALGTIGRSLDVDRGLYLQADRDGCSLEYTHEWCADGILPERHDAGMDYFSADSFPWFWKQLTEGTPVVISSLDDFPPEAVAEKNFEREQGTQSLVSVFIDVGGPTIGELRFETVRRQRSWSETVVNQLKLLGQVIANAVVRKRTDTALKESEELLRTFMDNTPALVTLESLDKRYLLVNRAFEEFLGSPDVRTVGTTRFQLLTEEHARIVDEHDQMVLDSNRAVTLDRDLTHVDGSRYCRRTTKFPVYDADENLIGIGTYAVDISEWKKAEEALRERESLINAISENLPGALFRRMLRPDGRLEFPFVSDSLHRVLGIDRDRVVDDSRVLLGALHPEDRQRWMAALHESADTMKQVSVDVRVDDPRGGTRWMRSIARPQKLEDGVVVWDGLALDVTDEKNADAALRESEERFRNLVEGSLQGIGIVDTEYAPVFVNNAYATMFGYRNSEHLQQLDSHLKLFTPEGRERIRAYGQARLRGDSVPSTCEVEGLRQDGSVIHIVTTMRLIAWKGNPAFQITATDITEQKRTEARLHDYQQQLRRLASEISLAEEKERRRIASELHDGAIQNLALAKIKLGELERGLGREEGSAALDEIRELLELSIHDARSLIFELSPPVLYELGLAAAIEWLGEQFQARYGITCHVLAIQNHAPVNAEIEVVLFQVLRELLVNVVKHANATRVDIALRRLNDRLSLQVSDDGDGFDAAAAVTGSGSGGFGLFNIRERLQLLGATLEIESGPGTRITVTAPLASETLAEKS